MKLDHDVVQSIACDYVTATAIDSNLPGSFHAVGTALFRHEADKGNKIKGWGMAGYKGWACGHVQLGKLDQRFIVRLSGDAAALSWRRIVELSDNVTRFDVQATVDVGPKVTQRIERHRRQARRFSKLWDEKPVVRRIDDNRGGYTLYLGARESNVFGRIYDKYAEKKLDHYRDCVRYEVQFNYALARLVAAGCSRVNDVMPVFASHVSQFLEARGVEPPSLDKVPATYCCPRNRSDADRKLLWLREAVRPSVMSLIALGRGEEALRALGLIDESESDAGPLGPAWQEAKEP